MRPDFRKSIEEVVIDQIASGLKLFSCQQNAYKFLCPYCQTGLRDRKGKPYAKGDAKGYLYQKGNAWNFKCHKSDCPTHTQKSGGKSFEKFLADHFPKEHLEYIRRRDELGLTGYQANCPSLKTVLKKQGVLPQHSPTFYKHESADAEQHPPTRPPVPAVTPSVPAAPKVTKLPPMRSPQQQAGQQSRLNHLVKQRQRQRRERQGW